MWLRIINQLFYGFYQLARSYLYDEFKLNKMSNLRSANYPRMSKLRTSTSSVHDQLDKKIMAQSPFENKANYGQFLRYQYYLMDYVAGLYQNSQLADMIPDLQNRDRCAQLIQDFQDLGMAQPEPLPTHSHLDASLFESLGWLYVIEGSKLGAAILAKEAEKLGLNSEFGARFLAGSNQGAHWRQFMQGVEEAPLSEPQVQAMLEGAQAAFKFANELVELSYAQSEDAHVA
ncbi:biliverdin-producing heme oxygenase [Pseudoalteromonas luteoviolacea]|uniref:Heme oxygenase n=1 Tax=Pseudoalteromonas luteoviolacea S4054 TaxID=1129367 RepID=A0A0F6AFE8_9GAMM|nr:biliverdin-producing heme oxygenase [Pseudoalteromonas luteoviolacea]AOT10034.1 hypothetical protein S4054249_20430 [Pseudoalteromonas luteoviolacea]AOT14945.1 hypothetical protein S40542_20400 [Pseudoalteromonas luteoviolacea]AOT19861.1 hypothetical protein S4054_20405 [Pseudoalteromonas luteoviolacea]KKE84883.1 hypothetical protein N479_07235 [Pseudoalteromonas luteoviolacea S4054]KZN72500.1 hypothetical protein N481_14825 [Pseudoalteromonas luteoviolacea S4047-1]